MLHTREKRVKWLLQCWLDYLQPDKPNCVMSWLDGLINQTIGWLDCVSFDMAVCKSVVPCFLVEVMPNLGVAVVLRD